MVGKQTGVATAESSMEITQKIKNRNALLLSDYTYGYIFEATQNTNSKEYMHP